MAGAIHFEASTMGPKPGYKQPGREGQKAIAVWADEELRAAFKIATIERGTTMQEELVRHMAEYAAPVLKRMKRGKVKDD